MEMIALRLLRIYFVLACIISVNCKYSQSEIDNAFKKMIRREKYYRPLDCQLGCWPNNVIPYIIQPGFSEEQVQNIYKHVYQIQNKTCVRWVEKKNAAWIRKHVEFKHSPDTRKVCNTGDYRKKTDHSNITTLISLTNRCFIEEAVIHEMLHALGLSHEHQRLDRDCYVVVDEDRAKSDSNFKVIYNFNAFEKWPYDKHSVVHYTRLPGLIKDIEEPWPGWLWRYGLGDTHSNGILTGMDILKLNYRFCGGPDYCAINNDECVKIEEQENKIGCRDIYVDIARGLVKPS